MKKKFFFTFGLSHTDAGGKSLFKNYTVIDAYDENQARRIMYAHRGDKWSHVYEDSNSCGVVRHTLTLVDLEDVMLPNQD